MVTLIGIGELLVFLYLTKRTLKNTDHMVDNVIFCYLCQIFNYRFFDTVPWLTVGISLYPTDFLVLLMLFVLVARGTNLYKNWFTYLWLIFFIFAAESMIRGMMTFGLSSLLFNDLRKYLNYAIGILYFAYVPFHRTLWSYEKKLDRLFLFLSGYIWLGVLLYLSGSALGTYGNLDRPLLSDYAIIMAAYTTFKWYKSIIIEGRITLLPIIFTITLVINRFNTTWVALLVAVMVVILFQTVDINSKRMTKRLLFQIAIMFLCIVTGYFALENTPLFASVANNFNKFDMGQNNTFSSRIELWGAAIATIDVSTVLFGKPMGSGMFVTYRGALWQASIHNGYLEIIMRTGIIGLLSQLGIMVGQIKASLRGGNILMVSVISVMLVYWGAYNITFEQGMLIGVCANTLLMRGNEREIADVYYQ